MNPRRQIDVRMVLRMVRSGKANAFIAAEAGVSPRTFERWRARHPEVNEEILALRGLRPRPVTTAQESLDDLLEQRIALGWPSSRIMVELGVDYETVVSARARLDDLLSQVD